MKRASVTVWFSLIVVSLCSMFFSMVETVRIMGMRTESKTITKEALASAFSEYQPLLWEQYEILGLDKGYGTEHAEDVLLESRICEFCQNNCDFVAQENVEGSNFFQLRQGSCGLKEYCLLTDEKGMCFITQAVNAARTQMAQHILEDWKESAGLGTDSKEIDIERQVEDAETAMDEAGKQQQPQSGTETNDLVTEQIDIHAIENPLTVFHEIKKNGCLGLVTEGREISEKAIDTNQVVSKRQLNVGTQQLPEEIKMGIEERVLYAWYLARHFGNFVEEKADRSLAYEMEYIIAGKCSDKENLENIIEKLLLLREGQNFITIMTNPNMLQEAYNVAVAIAGASLNPAAITLVQMAIAGVWALVESILDIRTMLHGEKIPIIKTAEQWTSSLYNLGSCLATSVRAKKAERGISYDQYLMVLLLPVNREKLGLRPLDLMETELQQQENYINVKMDHIVCSMDVACTYGADPLFASYIGLGNITTDWYQCQTRESISYL